MSAHGEPVVFNRSRYSELLVRIGLIGDLNRRERMLVWLTLLCFEVPDQCAAADTYHGAGLGAAHAAAAYVPPWPSQTPFTPPARRFLPDDAPDV